MLTLHATLAAELSRRDVDLRRMVTFEIVDGVEVSFVDGEDAVLGYPPCVVSAKPGSLEIDVFTREVSASAPELVMRADGVARQLVANHYVIGKLVTFRLGTPNVAEANWLVEARAVIEDVSISRSGEVTFSLADGLAYLQEYRYTGGFIGYHPLDVIVAIMGAAVPSELWDASTFDADADTTRSHWNLARWEATSLTWTQDPITAAEMDRARSIYHRGEPVRDGLFTTARNAWELVQELLMIVGGTLRLDSLGRIAFVAYDADAAAVAHLTPGRDYSDWEQTSAAGDAANRVVVDITLGSASANSIFHAADIRTPKDQSIVGEDTTAQGDLAVAGSAIDRVIEQALKTDWVRACGYVQASGADISAVATTLDVTRAAAVGMTGARWRDGFAGSIVGGIATTAVSVTSNVATATVASHWLTVGSYIRTTGHTVNASSTVQVTAQTATTVSYPLVTGDVAPMADGVGRIEPQQNPLDELISGREAYLLILSPAEDEAYEIVRATACAPLAGTDGFYDARGSFGYNVGPEVTRYTVVRAQRGTTAQVWANVSANVYVWDITIAVAIADQRVARHAYGIPTVMLRAMLEWARLQIGDVISHDAEMLLGRTGDGAIDGGSAAQRFEIVSRSVDKDEDPPMVALEMKYLGVA